MESRVTRRAALGRFAVLAGIAVAGKLPSSALAAPAAGFTDQRAAVLRALIAAYDRRPGSLVDASQADGVVVARARYDQGDPLQRQWIEALLDAVEVAPRAGSFSSLSVQQARRELQSWVGAVQPGDRDRFRYRPSDAAEPDDIAASNQRATSAIRAFTSTLPADSFVFDEKTMLPKFAPPNSGITVPQPRPIPDAVLLLRTLRVDSYKFVASIYSDDRYLVDDVILT